MIIAFIALLRLLLSISCLISPFAFEYFSVFSSSTIPYILALMYSDGINTISAVLILVWLGITLILWLVSIIALHIKNDTAITIGLIGFTALCAFDTICGILSYIGGEPSISKIFNVLLSLTIGVICTLALRNRWRV